MLITLFLLFIYFYLLFLSDISYSLSHKYMKSIVNGFSLFVHKSYKRFLDFSTAGKPPYIPKNLFARHFLKIQPSLSVSAVPGLPPHKRAFLYHIAAAASKYLRKHKRQRKRCLCVDNYCLIYKPLYKSSGKPVTLIPVSTNSNLSIYGAFFVLSLMPYDILLSTANH